MQQALLTPEMIGAREHGQPNYWNRRQNTNDYLQLIDDRDARLPIRANQEEFGRFLAHINQHQHVAIAGMMGCGKSTQVPQFYVHQAVTRDPITLPRLVMTVPRKVAATGVTHRTTAEMGGRRSDLMVATKMRGGDITSRNTIMEISTEGMMLVMVFRDPLMEDYSTVLFDEIHERSSDLDLLMSWSIWLRYSRLNETIQFGYMSATSNFVELLPRLRLPSESLITMPALSYDVVVKYLETPTADYRMWIKNVIVNEILPMANSDQPVTGDILIFLPGSNECESTKKYCQSEGSITNAEENITFHTLYADLAEDIKADVTKSKEVGSGRRIIFATNIAETSLTVQGLNFIIDTCYQKSNFYDPENNMQMLLLLPVSAAQASQRAGRVGRTSSGFVWRGVTEIDWQGIRDNNPFPQPKCLTEDHTPTLLKNLALVSKLKETFNMDYDIFPLINEPPIATRIRALDSLRVTGAVKIHPIKGISLTSDGARMAFAGVELHYAKALLASVEYGCVADMIDLVAAMSSRKPIALTGKVLRDDPEKSERQHCLSTPFGDHFTSWNQFNAWRHNAKTSDFANDHGLNYSSCLEALETAQSLTQQMGNYVSFQPRPAGQMPDITAMSKSLVAGHLGRIAVRLYNQELDPMRMIVTHKNWRDCSKNIAPVVSPATTVAWAEYPCILYSTARIHKLEDDICSVSDLMPVRIEWVHEAAHKLKMSTMPINDNSNTSD